MSSTKERLIEALIGKQEEVSESDQTLRDSLSSMLKDEVSEKDADEALRNLEKKPSDAWRWVWVVVVLGVSLALVLPAWYTVRHGLRYIQGTGRPASALGVDYPVQPKWASELSDQERLLVLGKEGETRSDLQWKSLWDSEKSNPQYYQQYALAHISENKALPVEFVESGEAIDPGNGWYKLVAASVGYEGVLKKRRMAWEDRGKGIASGFDFKDAEGFASRIGLLKAACDAERIERYREDIARQRSALIPRPESFLSWVVIIAMGANEVADLTLKGISELISAEAQRCAEEGDLEGFIELERVWARVAEHGLNDTVNLLDGLMIQVTFSQTLPCMRDAAAKLDHNAQYWTSLELEARQRMRRLKEERGNSNLELEAHGSAMAVLSLQMIDKVTEASVPPSKEALLPFCRVEQAFAGQLAMVNAWKLLGVIGLISWIVSVSMKRSIRQLGKRMSGLYSWQDGCWVSIGGIVAPLAVFLLVRYQTPLARLDWGPRLTFYVVPIGCFIALFLMLWVWPLVFSAWRMEKSFHLFSFPWTRKWMGWSAALSPVLAMVLVGLAVPPGFYSPVLVWAAVACGSWSLVWAVFRFGFGGYRKPELKVRKFVVGRMARPVWLGGMLAFVFLIQWFQHEERYWMAQDEIMQPSVSMTEYESRVTQQLVKELRELLK